MIWTDNERPLAYALPALVPRCALPAAAFLADSKLKVASWMCGTVVALQALFWSGQRFAGIGSSIYQPVNWTTVAAMSFVASPRRPRPPRTAAGRDTRRGGLRRL